MAGVMDGLPLGVSNADNRVERFLAAMHAERQRVRDFVAAYHTRLEQAVALLEEHIRRIEEGAESAGAGESFLLDAPDNDYRRRYELTLNDLRELRTKNLELQQQLVQARAVSSPVSDKPRKPDGTLDWEAEKRRILAALESDFDQNDPERQTERLKIETVLKTTEAALVAKDRAIAELKQQLEAPLRDGVQSLVASSATDQAVDGDAVIQEERRRLAQLQVEWREKLRRAEIELSMERAKLARQRAELDDRVQVLEGTTPSPSSDRPQAANADPPLRGRWLARLGLGDGS